MKYDQIKYIKKEGEIYIIYGLHIKEIFSVAYDYFSYYCIISDKLFILTTQSYAKKFALQQEISRFVAFRHIQKKPKNRKNARKLAKKADLSVIQKGKVVFLQCKDSQFLELLVNRHVLQIPCLKRYFLEHICEGALSYECIDTQKNFVGMGSREKVLEYMDNSNILTKQERNISIAKTSVYHMEYDAPYLRITGMNPKRLLNKLQKKYTLFETSEYCRKFLPWDSETTEDKTIIATDNQFSPTIKKQALIFSVKNILQGELPEDVIFINCFCEGMTICAKDILTHLVYLFGTEKLSANLITKRNIFITCTGEEIV